MFAPPPALPTCRLRASVQMASGSKSVLSPQGLSKQPPTPKGQQPQFCPHRPGGFLWFIAQALCWEARVPAHWGGPPTSPTHPPGGDEAEEILLHPSGLRPSLPHRSPCSQGGAPAVHSRGQGWKWTGTRRSQLCVQDYRNPETCPQAESRSWHVPTQQPGFSPHPQPKPPPIGPS